MMKERHQYINVNVNGIYEWGQGFTSHGAYENWYSAFRDAKTIFWRPYIDTMDSVFLVSIYAGGMIHPMDGLLFSVNPHGINSNGLKCECEELFELFKKAVCPYGSVGIEWYELNDDGTHTILYQDHS